MFDCDLKQYDIVFVVQSTGNYAPCIISEL